MNCKKGDLAVYVGRDIKCLGMIVRCVRLFPFADAWMTDPALPKDDGSGPALGVWDKNLRPIRDNDGEDEILRIAGKPVDHKVPA